MNEYIKLPLYDLSKDKVSSSIIDETFFYDLLVLHYVQIPRWKKKCENGLIQKKQANKEYLVTYKDKFNKRELVVSYNGKAGIYSKSKLLFSEDKIDRETITKINDYISLTDGMKQLILDLVAVYEYEGLERMNHPIRKSVFEQRELAVKMLYLFCLYGGGITSGQLIHIVNILQEFEMTSDLVCDAFRSAIIMEDKDKKEATLEIVSLIGNDEKEYVIKDLIYLLELGNYPVERDDKCSFLIKEVFNLEEQTIEQFRYKIRKEYVNG